MTFPGTSWQYEPDSRLDSARAYLDSAGNDQPYRVVVVRDGVVIAEWNQGVDPDEHRDLASAAKSIFSSVMGVVVEEGKLASPDVLIKDVYPLALTIKENEGPKPGRYVFEKDHAITFRHLIANCSGYMKPGEEPGKVFHYQTYGMNIFTHGLSTLYGLYDVNDPEGSPGFKTLVDRMIRLPIGANWSYYLRNFDLWENARLNIFGYYDGVSSTALDMARLGWLWCNWGRWNDQQLIPESWLREATSVNPMILENAAEDQWHYGYGFWTNEYGKLLQDAPNDSFMAAGAGKQFIWAYPAGNLVVVQSPSPWEKDDAEFSAFLSKIVEALA